MLFSTLTSLVLAATMASAMPALNQRQTLVCTGTYSNAQCCATDVLGVADLNCFNRESLEPSPLDEVLTIHSAPSTPTSADDFETICAADGQQAKCCVLPILGQALICQDPLGA